VLDWTVPGYRTDRELRAATQATGRTVRAVHEASGLTVALRFHAPADADAMAARRAEAAALASLRSPQIVHVYEHVEAFVGGEVGVATVREFVDGASVGRLTRAARLPDESSLVLLRSSLLALTAAHEKGVTHRGYKPENLLVDARGSVRLADFATTPGPGAEVADVRAAYELFAASVGKLPRKLRGLAGPGEAGHAAGLLEAVDQAGRTAWGAQWSSRGERELAGLVARATRREG
jgi:serine/threonine-protein kinase